MYCITVLYHIGLLSVADPDPGSGAFGPGIQDRFYSGSRIPDPHTNLVKFVVTKKLEDNKPFPPQTFSPSSFVAVVASGVRDPGSEIRDPRSEIRDLGSGIRDG
jgi:hypothetical protein